ncbi:hypothetical protein IMG5_103110 [Ichthyophthirius multifiliis]|uniref:EXPERA domain-containing protein n=1 Tax=Ichthyophthirius multifiliis TaxID=5932 RepID=G0QSR8_ICHMU|nr:hypothetical protein IMG5_103110 [Ichthyophthirius multifiliis]EGR31737.1 hypothetical protein IMG5_103110 [Ichthyophthirius multifiliis]|eukprot:XP_004035223.1 hypothetical protein IMG5_103110 [Ichthyophthirius multifiliis]
MVRTISLTELFLHGPLCLYTANLFLSQRGIKRDLFSLLSSFLQLIGTIFFVYDEYLNNFVNVCQAEGGCFDFGIKNVLLFWVLFVFINPLLMLLAFIHMYKAINNILAQERWKYENCAIENGYGGNYYDNFIQDEKPQQFGKKKQKKD